MKSKPNENAKQAPKPPLEGDERCSACPSEDDEGEGVVKPLRGYDLYLMHKYLVERDV